MKAEEAIGILTYHQEWRRGRDVTQTDVKQLTKAIDTAINLLSAKSREIEELKDILKRVGNDRDKDITDLKAEIEELKAGWYKR